MMLCLLGPPKCRAFIIICCYMPNKHNTSLKGLRACKDVLNELIGGTAELAACFHLFRTMAADTGVQYDSDALDECISMLTVMNRLMYRQMSELKHRQMMDIVTRKAVSGLERLGSHSACLAEVAGEVSHERE